MPEAVAAAPPSRAFELRLTPGERDIYRRVPFQPPSEWAEEHYVLMDGKSAGARWRNAGAPYLAGIMDTWADPDVEEVAVEGCPQSGKTKALHICLAYSADRRPGPKMLALANDSQIAKTVDNKFLPDIKASPTLRRKLAGKVATEIRFRDGSVCYLASAASATDRASVSVRDFFGDEQDLYEVQQDKAHPVDEFLERTTSYEGMRKHLLISKPIGVEGQSSIERAVEACDEVRDYHVPCPACRHEQVMALEGLVALGDCEDPAQIRRERLGRYRCADCGFEWSDHARNLAVRSGVWRTERPVRRPRSVGFRLPAFISPFVSLSEILADYLEAKEENTPSRWTHFCNSRLARAWRPVVSETPASQVMACVDPALPPRTVPRDAAFVTCGVDMQQTGFYFTAWAWAMSGEGWLVDYGYLPDFESVRAVAFETTYPRDGGGESIVHRTLLDTGGGKGKEVSASMTERAYRFILSCPSGRVYASKGAPKGFERHVLPRVIGKMPSSKSPIPGGITLYFLDTGYYKELVHASMQLDAANPARLHAETGQDFADQVTAERQVLQKGKLVWEKIRRANHYLDACMMAWAAASDAFAPSLRGLWLRHQHQEQQARKAQERTEKPVNPFTGRKTFWR